MMVSSREELTKLWRARLLDFKKLYQTPTNTAHQRDVYHAKIEALEKCLEDFNNWKEPEDLNAKR